MSGNIYMMTAEKTKEAAFKKTAVSMVPIKNKPPAIAGPTMKAPEATRLLMELNLFLLSIGTSLVIYTVEAGINRAFATQN
jgi:hypothetical protein